MTSTVTVKWECIECDRAGTTFAGYEAHQTVHGHDPTWLGGDEDAE